MSCLLSLLRQMTDRHYQQLLDRFKTRDELRVSTLASVSILCFRHSLSVHDFYLNDG